jgi:hypothetical protein
MGYMILNRTIPGKNTSDFEPLTHCRLHQWNHGLGAPLEEYASRRTHCLYLASRFTRTLLNLHLDCNPWITQAFFLAKAGHKDHHPHFSALVRESGTRNLAACRWTVSFLSLATPSRIVRWLWTQTHGKVERHCSSIHGIPSDRLVVFSQLRFFNFWLRPILHPRGTWDRHAQNSAQHTSIQDSAGRHFKPRHII